ncbi:hypothetical protein A3843_10380 [Pseudovibrio exalbescens]|uniref:Nickel/cobalt efflux protein RcnA n=2 Tax=Pseudovibrio exalbescens TaxID=197461 RepID=A0A1U7JHK4_9HYPH|nr:hypothetical protein A3843_10380 [Pseudovibrio exalbescens]
MRPVLIKALMLLCCVVMPGVALAHPHVFIQAKAELVFNDEGYLTHINHTWLFDDMYTAFAVQGLDADGDGTLSQSELKDLAGVNVQGMEEFGYFTFGDDTRVEMDFVTPRDEWMRMLTTAFDDYWMVSEEDKKAIAEDRAAGRDVQVPENVSMAELNFTLPLKDPLKADRPLTVDVYDPTYYVDFRWAPATAVTLKNPPGQCEVELIHPPELDAQVAAQLATIGADVRQIPIELRSITENLINQVIVTCDEAKAFVAENGGTGSALMDGQDAIAALTAAPEAKSTPLNGLGKSTAVATAQTPTDGASSSQAAMDSKTQSQQHGTGLWAQAMGTIAALQNDFYRELTRYLRSFRSSPEAGLWLMVISFLYGVFHAAGPGHGKAIISTYVVADEQTLKKGVVLSFLSSLAQAMTAIVLVGGVGVALSLTSMAITETTRWFEVGSYAMVFALGLWMVWTRVLRPLIPADLREALAETSCGCGQFETKDFDYEAYKSSKAKPVLETAGVAAVAEPVGAMANVAHHSHDHDHDHGHAHSSHHHHDHDGCCGHSHAPDPAQLKNVKLDLWSAWSIILAIGLRPCTGALIVLAFALSQGMIWAGIASTLVMGIGTGITVAAIASLAVLARDTAYGIWGRSSRSGVLLHRTVSAVGSLFVCMIGGALFFASVGWY